MRRARVPTPHKPTSSFALRPLWGVDIHEPSQELAVPDLKTRHADRQRHKIPNMTEGERVRLLVRVLGNNDVRGSYASSQGRATIEVPKATLGDNHLFYINGKLRQDAFKRKLDTL